jgi:hypothetical protein
MVYGTLSIHPTASAQPSRPASIAIVVDTTNFLENASALMMNN